MPVQGAEKTYLIKPGEKVNLGKRAPDCKKLYEDGNKESYLPAFNLVRDELQELQKVLFAQQKHRLLVIIQAMDTGGKDGCVKHVFSRVDPQGIRVTSFKKPNEEELARDFLWRVHQKVPRNGEIAIFNRSHYEDIIAVRVKNLFPKEVWKRRYEHILNFEKMLADEGTTIIKIFLHISKREQRARLQSRLEDPLKHWKLNPDDLEDRGLWGDFMETYEDLIERTTTSHAPWYVIPADRKWYRNLCVSRIMVEALRNLNLEYPKPSWSPGDIHISD